MTNRRTGRVLPHPRTWMLAALVALAVADLIWLRGTTRLAVLVILGIVAFLTLATWDDARLPSARVPRNHLHPTARAWKLALLGMVLAALPAFAGGALLSWWLLSLVVLLLLLAFDGLRIASGARHAPALDARTSVFVNERFDVHLRFDAGIHPGARRVRTLLETSEHVEAPDTRSVDPKDQELVLPVQAARRGRGRLERLWIQATGPLGLMALDRVLPLDHDVTVTPDIRPVRQAAIRFFDPRTSRVGLKIERYMGDGSEFDAMREYVPGFDSRSISWRATARHRRLICHEFRAERNHDVVVAWDTGRLMSEKMEGGTRLDHALAAGLVLAYAALRTGDRVGAFAFGARPEGFVAPSDGRQAFPHLQQFAGNLEYGTGEANFTLGLTTLAQHLRRRTLVVLLTDFVDTITAELMIENLSHLLRRHVVVFVSVQDPALQDLAGTPLHSGRDLLTAFVAGEQARDRDTVLRRLARLGAYCLEARAEDVGTKLLNRYLEIRRRELV